MMNVTGDYARQAELALAAYATLGAGTPDPVELKKAGMAPAEAQQFASSWRVVTQYNQVSDPYPVFDDQGQFVGISTTTNGLSATVFEEISTGQRYLAIRGTDDFYDIATDLVSVLLLGDTKFQGQYQSLRIKVQEWLADGTLP